MERIKTLVNRSFENPHKWKKINNFRMPTNFEIKKRIGSPSTFGSVYEIDDKCKYVLKIMKTPEDYHKKMFMHELLAGSIKNIELSGVRIYAYIILSPNIRALIMDHVLLGNTQYTALSFNKYILSDNHNAKIYKLLASTLDIFYKTTQGFHGDLHLENIMVVLDKSKTIKYIKIIDYGTWTPFQRILPFNSIFIDTMKHVHNEWSLLHGRLEGSGRHYMKSVSYGLIRSNKDMLDGKLRKQLRNAIK